jgi:large subunit ribosomal protein L35
VALATAGSVPFEQLPFQCFQEARKVLMEDRAEKVKMIEKERAKIARLREVPDEQAGGTRQKETRLRSMQTTLEHWKILADINDPMVKKRFEDGLGMPAND